MRPTLRKLAGIAAILAICVNSAWATTVAAAPSKPFPQHVNYGAGTILPSQYTRAQLDAHVRHYYAVWKARYVVAAGTDAQGKPLYRIALGKPNTANHAITVSEGQGYGMLILPIMAGHDPQAQAIFNGLDRYARRFASGGDPRLMSWRIRNGVPIDGRDSAFDGDADIALGLVMADRQWGSTAAANYAASARTRLAGILASTIGAQSRLPLLGDWVDPAGVKYNQWSNRPSDFMPASFETFRRFTGLAAWSTVTARVRATTDVLQRTYSPGKGLIPDFIQPVSATDHTPRPASPNFLEAPGDGFYSYNACRMPLRSGLDALFYKNAQSLAAVRRLTQFARTTTGGDPQLFHSGYKLTGASMAGTNFFSLAFVGPLGVAAMSVPSGQAWLDAIYDDVRNTFEDYYEDSLALLSLLVMSGNFWNPTP